jgi:hypothetical protein
MSNKFPSWSGVILGPIIAGCLALNSDMKFSDESTRRIFIVLMAGIGLLAGLVVWWKDSRK